MLYGGSVELLLTDTFVFVFAGPPCGLGGGGDYFGQAKTHAVLGWLKITPWSTLITSSGSVIGVSCRLVLSDVVTNGLSPSVCHEAAAAAAAERFALVFYLALPFPFEFPPPTTLFTVYLTTAPWNENLTRLNSTHSIVAVGLARTGAGCEVHRT